MIEETDVYRYLLGFLFSCLGLAYLRYGKTQGKISFVFFGMALLISVYFLETMLQLSLVGSALACGPILRDRF